MANIVIDIASEFTGNKAFKQAESATDKLGKNVKKLAGALGLALGTQQILAYGKAAVKAAVADEKAQKQLALALKNVGLGRDAATSEAYIQKLQSEFGIVDDLLRPAYQTLAVATRDTAEAQRLLNLALDISASTGKDLGSVTGALSKAYLGNNTALSKLGVGISKADLKTKSFLEVTDELAKTFAGAATESANSLAGQMAKLEVASSNVQEILGKGIIDSLMVLGEDTSIEELASDMEKAAVNAAALLVSISKVIKAISEPLVVTSNSLAWFIVKTDPFVDLIIEGDPSGFFKKKPKPFSTAMTISGQVQVKQQTQITKLTKEQATAQSKITKDKKLQAAIDKANLALNKGSEIFDMDKIQIAAALTNQAEQLGKATSGAQVLQIANDIARLNVKRDILALEDAIASKDEAAIVAATNKLNADLKVLSALGQQNIKLLDIKSILETLKPKDLINLDNLNEALRLLGLINLASTGSKTTPAGKPTPAPSTAGLTPATTIAETNANVAALGGVVTQILPNLKEFTPDTGMISGISPNGREFNFSVTVNTGVGDPNAIAEAVTQVIQDAVDRGTLRGGSY